ncbi:TetR/AcrR family transcriptional regulator [Candidatus Hydrogenisulfobacillus filiaventi]|uniref:TetR/AcrR family transcriptional regulator n=1 Tax=Candidatus Hydrogenisulfobacillus filiaventi TaxID=2707344 RepID=A0A6F8ZFW0_9FIRM|nr:TetR/AcrR family transcriptional regulator [Bacillota bacterium]CAB1128523.1 TetR/AcrR family transcriptional regulator [Candidatus Hydrogenisulfobacillus filiaventi]
MAGFEERDRREDLLIAAQQVFGRYGYHDATVRAITETAGCAAGTFYLYFASKEDCFLALVERLYERIMAAVVEARRGAAHASDKLYRSLWAVVDTLAADPELARVVMVRAAGAGSWLEERLWRLHDTFAEFIAQDLEESGLDPVEARTGARAWFGALNELVGVWARRPPEAGATPTLEEEVGRIQRLFWRGWGLPWPETPVHSPRPAGSA